MIKLILKIHIVFLVYTKQKNFQKNVLKIITLMNYTNVQLMILYLKMKKLIHIMAIQKYK